MVISEISRVVFDIQAERNRQISKGYTKERDQTYDTPQLAMAACSILTQEMNGYSHYKYAKSAFLSQICYAPDWVYEIADKVEEKHTERQRLVIAAALIAAEIERVDIKNGGTNW